MTGILIAATLALLIATLVIGYFVGKGRLVRRILCVVILFGMLWFVPNYTSYRGVVTADTYGGEADLYDTESGIFLRSDLSAEDILYSFWMVPIQEVITSSDLGSSHVGPMMIDGDFATSWQEGEAGYGEGSCFAFGVDEFLRDGYIVIWNGNQRSENSYWENGRICRLEINDDCGNCWTVELPDQREPVVLEMKGLSDVTHLVCVISEVYADGTIYEDTCVSEFQIYQ